MISFQIDQLITDQNVTQFETNPWEWQGYSCTRCKLNTVRAAGVLVTQNMHTCKYKSADAFSHVKEQVNGPSWVLHCGKWSWCKMTCSEPLLKTESYLSIWRQLSHVRGYHLHVNMLALHSAECVVWCLVGLLYWTDPASEWHLFWLFRSETMLSLPQKNEWKVQIK